MGLLSNAEQAEQKFLPTPSARRATDHRIRPNLVFEISTHALREEGDTGHSVSGRSVPISTHALREEGDPPPLEYPPPMPISTHALREEDDPPPSAF